MLNKLIKSVLVVVILGVSVLQFSSCSSKNDEPSAKKEFSTTPKSKDEGYTKLQKIVTSLYLKNPFATNAEISNVVAKEFQVPNISNSRALSTSSKISFSANKTLEEMKSIDPSLYSTKELYVNKLLDIINANEKSLSLSEKNALILTTHISADLIELRYGNSNSNLRGIGDWFSKAGKWVKKQWNSWGKCAAGIVGGAGGGALTGAGVGSVVPGLGTTAGAVIGGVSGGLSGASKAC